MKLAEARKRAMLWSECELQKRQINQTQARAETISLTDTPASASGPSVLNKLLTLMPNKGIVSSLQKTIRDIKIQRRELDITIKVLPIPPNQLISNNSHKTKSYERSKQDGN